MSKLGSEVLSKGDNWTTLPCFNLLVPGRACVFSWSVLVNDGLKLNMTNNCLGTTNIVPDSALFFLGKFHQCATWKVAPDTPLALQKQIWTVDFARILAIEVRFVTIWMQKGSGLPLETRTLFEQHILHVSLRPRQPGMDYHTLTLGPKTCQVWGSCFEPPLKTKGK